jgi:hypothetical protein
VWQHQSTAPVTASVGSGRARCMVRSGSMASLLCQSRSISACMACAWLGHQTISSHRSSRSRVLPQWQSLLMLAAASPPNNLCCGMHCCSALHCLPAAFFCRAYQRSGSFTYGCTVYGRHQTSCELPHNCFLMLDVCLCRRYIAWMHRAVQETVHTSHHASSSRSVVVIAHR